MALRNGVGNFLAGDVAYSENAQKNKVGFLYVEYSLLILLLQVVSWVELAVGKTERPQ